MRGQILTLILTDLTEDEIAKYRDQIWDFAYDIECEYNFTVQLAPTLKNVEKNSKVSFRVFSM